MSKQRLDVFLVDTGLVEDLTRARGLILAGKVRVDGLPVDKAGHQVAPGARVQLAGAAPFVSRGGLKLAHALDTFRLDVRGFVCADVGASTGGFTDCLLQRGAAHVVAIDVGYGQLAWALRGDERVTVLERTNVRYLETLPDARQVDLVTIDVSFIGLNLVIPPALHWLKQAARGGLITLIKPQFEAARGRVGKGGVVREVAVQRDVLHRVLLWASTQNLDLRGLVASPISGPAGNREFLAWLVPGTGEGDLPHLIDACLGWQN